jgi:hypothetical protein
MALVFVLFWVVLIWGLYDGDIYAKEGTIMGILWAGLLAGFIFLPDAAIGFIIAMVLLDIYLLLKVYGQDIGIR